MTQKEKIKIWDDNICSKHVINLVHGINNIITKNGIEKLNYVDIGANVGKVYDLLSQRIEIEKVWMFEASPILFSYLKEKYSNNTKVRLENFAVDNSTGIVHFDESSMLYQFDSNVDEYNFGLSKIMHTNLSQEVNSIKISDYFNDNPQIFNSVDFIKIDTESVDFNILVDLTNVIEKFRKKPIIEFEVNYMNAGFTFDTAQMVLDEYIKFGYNKLFLNECHGDGLLIPENIII
jgi:FkbM family methyltransferase